VRPKKLAGTEDAGKEPDEGAQAPDDGSRESAAA